MELKNAIFGRRSIRQYAPCEVKKEEIEELVRCAQASPSWKNSQTARFYASVSPEAKQNLRGCLASFNYDRTENAGAFIVTTVEHGISGYTAQGETHLGNGFECFDNGLAVENLLLAAYEMGYGSLIMGLYKEKELRSLLNIPEGEHIVAVIAIGKADVDPEMPERNSIDKVLKIF